MKRHKLNIISLVPGVILILLAAGIALPVRNPMVGFPRWILPAAVILVGVALLWPLFSLRGDSRESPGSEGDAESSKTGISGE